MVRGGLAVAVVLTACAPPSPSVVAAEPGTVETSGGDVEALEGAGEAVVTTPRFSFLDVGQGDCIHVDCGDGYDIVVDYGSVGGGDRAATAIRLNELLGADDATIEVLIITHADTDHFNYVAPTNAQASVLGERRVGLAMLGGHRDHYRATQAGQRLEAWLSNMADEVA